MKVKVASVIARVAMESHHTSKSDASSGGHFGHLLISFFHRERTTQATEKVRRPSRLQ